MCPYGRKPRRFCAVGPPARAGTGPRLKEQIQWAGGSADGAGRKAEVARRRGKTAVTQQKLDSAEVSSGFEHEPHRRASYAACGIGVTMPLPGLCRVLVREPRFMGL